jgi:flavin-dependent thymidylate synthase
MTTGDGSSLFEQMGGTIINPEATDRIREAPTQPGTNVMRYADEAMFQAQHVPLEPTVDVVDMTRNPLKVMAAPWLGYRGRYILPDQVTDEEAMEFAGDALKSKIAAPLEWCQVALLIRGVSRDFTHQMVRQRTATFVQESMRFAVKDNTVAEIPIPLSVSQAGEDMVDHWLKHVKKTAGFYEYMIGNGIPAEDARKALLIGTTTQLHYRTNLRDLINHAGLRLCSQAQAEWKEVWRAIVEAIIGYGPLEDSWQQREIVKMFRPVCYATGKCEFMGIADRWCVIRDRVEAHHAAGDRPETWSDINPHECLHPEAARTDNPAWRM